MAEKCLIEAKIPRNELINENFRVHKESVSKQGRKFAKGESPVQRDPLFDAIPEDTVDHMETKNAQDEGRTREMVDEDKEIDENYSRDEVFSTDRQIEGTEEQIESTDGKRKGTEDHTEEGSATQATQTPTSTIFGDDETIAKVLLNMSQAKAVSREKEIESLKVMERVWLGKYYEEWKVRGKVNRIDEEKASCKVLPDTIAAQRKIPAQQRIRGQSGKNTTTESMRISNDDLLEDVGNFKHAELKNQEMNEKGVDSSKSKDSKRKVEKKFRRKVKKKFRRRVKKKRVQIRENLLRLHLTIAPDEEKEVDYEILDRKYPIKEWKIECLGIKPQDDKAEHLEEINQNVVIRNVKMRLPEGLEYCELEATWFFEELKKTAILWGIRVD
ncbi:hypothetical protein Tco_0290133 [Tanacetum coccineum]